MIKSRSTLKLELSKTLFRLVELFYRCILTLLFPLVASDMAICFLWLLNSHLWISGCILLQYICRRYWRSLIRWRLIHTHFQTYRFLSISAFISILFVIRLECLERTGIVGLKLKAWNDLMFQFIKLFLVIFFMGTWASMVNWVFILVDINLA